VHRAGHSELETGPELWTGDTCMAYDPTVLLPSRRVHSSRVEKRKGSIEGGEGEMVQGQCVPLQANDPR
jgi:hypothetical protein